MRALAVFLAFVALPGMLAGCAMHPDAAPSELIGKSVAGAAKEVPSGRSYAWYDLSQEVLHKEGSLIGGDDPDGAGGVIIAVCANANTLGKSSKITAGAIPKSDYHGPIRRKAEAGEYRTLLPECQPQ
ncbi:hypothetical protein FHW23_001177 [Curtobacterium pusillum]|uniref:Lipoprotein n=1 Tax=Curtobacterium pusillum TaxID=69373 RepID=A0AAW3T3X6_9MICO|nr:hypothetical protein [Curtobacterium pusillum]MBA8989931.1 hypothetical protein [Curtobacterium pusillum]